MPTFTWLQTSGKSGVLGPDAQLPVVLERSSEHELVVRELLQAIRLVLDTPQRIGIAQILHAKVITSFYFDLLVVFKFWREWAKLLCARFWVRQNLSFLFSTEACLWFPRPNIIFWLKADIFQSTFSTDSSDMKSFYFGIDEWQIQIELKSK